MVVQENKVGDHQSQEQPSSLDHGVVKQTANRITLVSIVMLLLWLIKTEYPGITVQLHFALFDSCTALTTGTDYRVPIKVFLT